MTLLMLGIGSVWAGDLEDGIEAYQSKNYDKALRLLQPRAEQGAARAQASLGAMYVNGWGVPKDYDIGHKWIRLAVAQGDVQGQASLGFSFYSGRGLEKDYAEALKYYKLAAAQGHAAAPQTVGYMYEVGLGVNIDIDEAARWYQKAAAQGNLIAKKKLESTWAMKAAAERVGAADALPVAQNANSELAASSDKEQSSSTQWVLPVKLNQPVIQIARSVEGELATTFLVKPLTPVVSPRDGVLIYKGALNTSEFGLVLSHGDGLYSVISSQFEWEPSNNALVVGSKVLKGGALVSSQNNSFGQTPVLWRLFGDVEQNLDPVRGVQQVLAGSEIDTKKLLNLVAVQFNLGVGVAPEDEFSVILRSTTLTKADLLFNAFLLEAGQHEIEVVSGRFFKNKKKGTVYARTGGTSIQIVQRASNGDIDASTSEFVPNHSDAGSQLASAGSVSGVSGGAEGSAGKAAVSADVKADAKEQERLAQEAQAKESERLAQEAKTKEQERLAQVAAEKEKLRVAQESKTKEQERLAQAAKVREQERLAQAAAEQEKLRVAEAARVQEQARLAQEAQAKQAQRLAQEARTQEKERLAQEERVKNELLLAARQRDDELLKLRQQLAKLEDEKVSKDQQTIYATRRALVIGNDSYRQVTKLVNAREDARAIAESLQQVGYQVTLKLDLTEKDMKAALRTFKGQVEGGDEVLVFFAGHGVQFGAANYLLPVDIAGESEEQIKDESIQLQRVLDDMSEKKAKFTLAMIDACRDNPFKTVNRNIGGRGLAPTTAATGQMVIFSAGAGQQALDKLGPADKSRNGLFTRIFLKEMQKPGVSIDKVVRNVRNEVVGMAKSVGHEQVPAIYDQVVGEFYFRR